MSPRDVEVRIQDLQDRTKRGVPRPWIVRWVVGTRNHSKSFPRKAEAERYRRRLGNAVDDGERFDVIAGVPLSWLSSGITVADQARTYVQTWWPDWMPRTRQDVVSTLARVVELFVSKHAPPRPAHLVNRQARRLAIREWLRGDDTDEVLTAWLDSASLQVDEVTGDDVRRVLTALEHKDNGARCAPATAKRLCKDTKAFILSWAGPDGPLDEAPIAEEKKRTTSKTSTARQTTVHPTDIPSTIHAFTILACLPTHQPGSRTIELLIEGIYWTGWRPSEARALRIENLKLPDVGWGEAIIDRSCSTAGESWLDDGEAIEGPTKARAVGDPGRVVPLPPALVRRLKLHLGARTEGLVFPSSRGGRLTMSNIDRSWKRAKERALVAGHYGLTNNRWTPYSLRHLHASLAIAAGLPFPEIANRLGHSVETLCRVYAHAVDEQRDESNRRLEEMLQAA